MKRWRLTYRTAEGRIVREFNGDEEALDRLCAVLPSGFILVEPLGA